MYRDSVRALWHDTLGIMKMLATVIKNPSQILEYMRWQLGSRHKDFLIIKAREYFLEHTHWLEDAHESE
jgi:hypothetical protein